MATLLTSVCMFLLTGARKRELLDTCWADFNLDLRKWSISTSKSGKRRNTDFRYVVRDRIIDPALRRLPIRGAESQNTQIISLRSYMFGISRAARLAYLMSAARSAAHVASLYAVGNSSQALRFIVATGNGNIP
jgi:integrase